MPQGKGTHKGEQGLHPLHGHGIVEGGTNPAHGAMALELIEPVVPGLPDKLGLQGFRGHGLPLPQPPLLDAEGDVHARRVRRVDGGVVKAPAPPDRVEEGLAAAGAVIHVEQASPAAVQADRKATRACFFIRPRT